MYTIKDYIAWRGDIPLSFSPLNEIDKYILSKIGVLDLTGIVPDDGDISVECALDIYLDRFGESVDLGLWVSPETIPIMRMLARSVRFSKLRLSHFVKRFSIEDNEQFGALTIEIPGIGHYITFRGTDDALTSWKENFMLALEDAVAAQRDALAYLESTAMAYDGPLMVGGHSKGGNLAIFASARAKASVKARIREIYAFDSPGFQSEFLRESGYLTIKPLIRAYVPQYSIVGMLLARDTQTAIVKTRSVGPIAHDGFVWEVSPEGFMRCDALSRSSRAFDESINEIVNSLDMQKRRALINDFFMALESTGAKTLSDLNAYRIHAAISMMRSLYRTPSLRRFLMTAFREMLREYMQHPADGD